jgi:uncharacterized protein (TIRG00374 family)
MSGFTPKFTGLRSIGFMVIGLAAFLAYLYFFVGFDGLIKLIENINVYQYSLFYSLAIAAVILSVFFDSLIWYYLLKGLSTHMKFRKVMLYNWIGNFVEMVIPCETVCGEATRIYLAQKEPENNAGISAATVISSRMLSTFVYMGGLLVGFVSLLLTHQLPVYLLMPIIIVSVGTAAVIGLVIYIAFKESAAERLVNILMKAVKIIVKNPRQIELDKEALQKSLFSFSEAFKTYKKKPRLLLKPAIFAVIAWVFILFVYLLVFYSLNYTGISLLDLATVYCIASTVETVTAGFPVGAVEITMINLYSLYGVPIVVAVGATTLTRLLTFWCQVLIGYPLINWIGLKSSVSKSIRMEEPIPSGPLPKI